MKDTPPVSYGFRLPPSYFFWIMFGLVLGVGNLLFNINITGNLLYPYILVLGAALPTLAVLSQAARRLGAPASWIKILLILAVGGTVLVGLAIVLESILPLLAYLLLPARFLSDAFYSFSGSDPNLIEKIFFTPTLILFLMFVAIQAPIPEEFSKALGPAMFGRWVRSESEAFMLGLASGAGFAIVENMLYESLYAQWNGWTWGGITLLRGFGSIMHPLCTAIISLAIYRARTSGRNWLATIGPAYLISVGIHTLWNGGFEPLIYLSGLGNYLNKSNALSIYGEYVQIILVVFLAGVTVLLWLYFNHLLNQLSRGQQVVLGTTLVSRRALAILAVTAVAVLVPLGAMLGPAWDDIHAAAVGGLTAPTPAPTPTRLPNPTSASTPTSFEYPADSDVFHLPG